MVRTAAAAAGPFLTEGVGALSVAKQSSASLERLSKSASRPCSGVGVGARDKGEG